MSILCAKELHCDGCNEWFRLEYYNLSDCWPKLRKEGWTRKAGKHWCPKCGFQGSWEKHEREDEQT